MSNELYSAQDGKLYCNNPRTDSGPTQVAVCVDFNDIPAMEVAIKLAYVLNATMRVKDKAKQKDDALYGAVGYLLSIDSKGIPGQLRNDIMTAYEI